MNDVTRTSKEWNPGAIAAALDDYARWFRLHDHDGRANQMEKFATQLRAIAEQPSEDTGRYCVEVTRCGTCRSDFSVWDGSIGHATPLDAEALQSKLNRSAHEPPAEPSDIEYLTQCLVEQEAVLQACEKLLKEALSEGWNADFDTREERYWEQSKALGDWRSRNLRLSQPPAPDADELRTLLLIARRYVEHCKGIPWNAAGGGFDNAENMLYRIDRATSTKESAR